ncbi:MAG: YihY/virulence factor BrkB family protein [Acidimicrobiales bacterium]
MTEGEGRPGFIAAVKEIPGRIKAHNVVVTAAGIAFFGLLALVPTLIAIISVYGLVNQGNEDDIKQQIEDAAGALDESTKEFVSDQLTSITTSDGNLAALVFSILLALFSASGAVQKMMGTTTIAYDAEENRPGWKVRLLAYGFTFGAVLGMVLMVTAVGIIPAALDTVDLGSAAKVAIQFTQLPVLGILMVVALTVLYRYGPDRSVKTPWINPGAWLATGLWVLFAVMFSLYSSRVGELPSSYGLLGTVAALMIFLQLTALAVIIGAEYNAVVEESDASAARDVAPPPAEPLGFGKAAAGVAALFLLGKGQG